jgi:tetratricopeptide (TPR) repeat protein
VASSSDPRWRLACDACDATAWVGATAAGFDAWCEACQLAQALPAAPPDARSCCRRCGARLAAAPRFVELWGKLQQLDAVLAAWEGDAAPIATLLPERPVFVTDLTPPEARDDDAPALRAQLAALARGEWRAVLAAPLNRDTRAHAARAIAHERSGDTEAAVAAWTRVLAAGADERARLARGSLLARAGRRDEARADLARAGDSFAARWDRAALLVLEALEEGMGPPDATRLARARAEAGAPSAYWSDPTVGRLLVSRVVARASGEGVGAPGRASEAECSLLRFAERQLEHDTFWDRALRLVGWVRLGVPDEVARVAAPLARREAESLANEPALAGRPLGGVAGAVVGAISAIEQADPARARRSIAGALARDDLRRFRLPCARCGRGSIGVDEVRETLPEPA